MHDGRIEAPRCIWFVSEQASLCKRGYQPVRQIHSDTKRAERSDVNQVPGANQGEICVAMYLAAE